MNIDTTGIKNENEYYYEHYFSSMLGEGLKPVFDSWSEEEKAEKKPPNKLFESFRQDFLKARARVEKTRNMSRILEDWRPSLKKIIEILGYEYSPSVLVLSNGDQIPIVGRVNRSDGSPEVILIEALSTEAEYMDGLKCSFLGEQFPEDFEEINIPEKNIEDLVSLALFDGENPPRWVLIFAKDEITLIDRSKWSEKRLMRFDLDEIMGRKEPSTIKATVALLHKDQLVPKDGVCLLDSLDENSHKHAHGVSEDLKYSLREAIELIGQEAVDYIKRVRKEKIYEREDDIAEQLSLECLRYMYRLLFLFYIESRPELGYAPMNSETYRKGYSLEALRDLELTRLTTPEAQDGFAIHEWIERLFSLVYNGEGWESETLGMLEEGSRYHTFTMPPLKAHLFDPERTPILSKVKFRNKVLQKVIELMSLSREKERGSQKRGRVSYSELGINQLGAVYEALLSFRGFFAEEDLYEVKKADTNPDPLEPAYFVTESDLSKYDEEEKVFNSDGTYKIYGKGTFIYRLSGRDREKSASFYTPEVLTQSLVKYSLRELLKGKTADDILRITVCEPAMGSAAFLNEAVNQLSEAYLIQKQKELGQNIPHDEYLKEKQKVKTYLADNNVFGVDLNPVAVELAEVSLWLNTIHEGGFVPWFGMQLVAGNSLVGARRAFFDGSMLLEKPPGGTVWLNAAPEYYADKGKRGEGDVYHFLLPATGMSNYKDRVVKSLVPDEILKFKNWLKEFTKPYDEEEINQLSKISSVIDRLWSWHENKNSEIRSKTTDYINFFGRTDENTLSFSDKPTPTSYKDKILEEVLFSKGVMASSPYSRLKLVMDYWCSLWFWPISEANNLPTRSDYLMDVAVILMGHIFEENPGREGKQLFSEFLNREDIEFLESNFGLIDLEKMVKANRRLSIVREVAEKHRFLHWELEFADILKDGKGFDLILGNPPWIQVRWQEGALLSDFDPIIGLKNVSATRLRDLRSKVLEDKKVLDAYLSEYSSTSSTQNFLSNLHFFSLLKGMKSNLYKCFLPLSWYLGDRSGLVAFVHPDGVYEDPRGGGLRSEIYKRLRYHFQFQNEKELFKGTNDHGRMRFGVHIYSSERPFDEIKFININNLFLPSTIDSCFSHDGGGVVPGIKNSENKWDLTGHKDRILEYSFDDLRLIANIFDENGTSAEHARLPAVHSKQIFNVLKKFGSRKDVLGSFSTDFFSTQMWNETTAQDDEIIERKTVFPASNFELILSGPHFYVGNPLNKTPRSICTANGHYDIINLQEIPKDYLPRTNYMPLGKKSEYLPKVPLVDFSGKPVTDYYRFVHREMIGNSGERTFVGAIMPPEIGHINTCLSHVFKKSIDMVQFCSFAMALPIDFRVRVTNSGHANSALVNQLPTKIQNKKLFYPIIVRTLLLNCLTENYAQLWADIWQDDFASCAWTDSDGRLDKNKFASLSKEWSFDTPFRNPYERRQALVELDVLIAMELGLNLDELITLLRVQFPVLLFYDLNTFYDSNGMVVFTVNKGMPGVGLSRRGWESIKDMESGEYIFDYEDNNSPSGPASRSIHFTAPFLSNDRVEDYKKSWAEFEKRFNSKEGD